MSDKISEIHKKFGDIPFKMALSHLISVGSDNFTKENVTAAIEKINKECDDISFIAMPLQKSIVNCAYELSKEDIWDVLQFVQANIRIDNLLIHEGKIISFWQNCTEGIIAYIIVPSETTVETIDKAVGILTERMNKHEQACHDFCNFDYSDNIIDAFKECGISAKILSADREISL